MKQAWFFVLRNFVVPDRNMRSCDTAFIREEFLKDFSTEFSAPRAPQTQRNDFFSCETEAAVLLREKCSWLLTTPPKHVDGRRQTGNVGQNQRMLPGPRGRHR